MPTEQSNIAPGEIIDGRVQGITNFGAFVELPGGKVGLVHISEIADTYVKDVKDYVKEGDNVRVKILNISGKKIGLSIKQALPPRERVQPSRTEPPKQKNQFSRNRKPEPVTLDDKIAKFLKESDERMQPLKNRMEPKRRNRS
ncbi:MAG TPA: S1 RNA-binding domain-containing protein [Syntrophomonadaceae bacterium]|nr:S1 RNA-binding domain-containing protein [Syntrophomonadaceae bacterium]